MAQIDYETLDKIIGDITAELHRAEKKFPDWQTDIVHQIAIVAEEAGEALQAANNCRWHGGSKEAVRAELIQTGAMVFRALGNLGE